MEKYYNLKLHINRDEWENKWGIRHRKRAILRGHSSNQCESIEFALLRITPFTLTGPQISASIPSETDYRGLSQTHGIITGSPLGHCSLYAPQMKKNPPVLHSVPEWEHCEETQAHFHQKNSGKQFFSLCVCCCSLHTFPTRILLFFLFPPYLQYQVCLCV